MKKIHPNETIDTYLSMIHDINNCLQPMFCMEYDKKALGSISQDEKQIIEHANNGVKNQINILRKISKTFDKLCLSKNLDL